MVNNSSLLDEKIKIFLNPPFLSAGVLAIVALVFTQYYFLLTNEYYPPAYADKIASFQADKVFQKRFLVPVAANFISENTPLCFDKSLKFVTALSAFGLLYYFNKLLKIHINRTFSQFWCIVLLMPVSWNYMFINSIYHAYDIPTLYFYIFCLYLFLSKKYFLFYIIFLVATLNRESTCFISISIALLLSKFNSDHRLKENFRRNFGLIIHLLSQAILWFLTVLLIDYLVRDSPGQSYEATYSMQVFIANMWNGYTSWPFLDAESFFGNPRSFITLFGCTWLLIPFVWKYIPKDYKKLLLLIPIYMIPAILYANLMETRVYHELNVVITLAFTSGLIQFNAHRNTVSLNQSC